MLEFIDRTEVRKELIVVSFFLFFDLLSTTAGDLFQIVVAGETKCWLSSTLGRAPWLSFTGLF